MKLIFGPEALQVLPCQTGFIFVLRQEEYEDKAVITYKMLDFERQTLAAVTRNVYLLNKFGNRFEQFETHPDGFLGVNTLLFSDRRVLVCTPEGKATVYDGDGVFIERADLTYQGEAPDSLVMGDGSFWASYKKAGAVIGYAAHNLRRQMRIGGGKAPLATPAGLYYQHECLLVCSPMDKTVYQLNPKDFSLEEYHTFEEPVHRYYKYNSNEIVVLDSGVYKL